MVRKLKCDARACFYFVPSEEKHKVETCVIEVDITDSTGAYDHIAGHLEGKEIGILSKFVGGCPISVDAHSCSLSCANGRIFEEIFSFPFSEQHWMRRRYSGLFPGYSAIRKLACVHNCGKFFRIVQLGFVKECISRNIFQLLLDMINTNIIASTMVRFESKF